MDTQGLQTRAEGIAKLLTEHDEVFWDDDRNAYFCDCGEKLTQGSEQVAHQAAVVDEWLAGQEREESRVLMQDPWVDEFGNENDGYMYVTAENGRNVLAKGRWPVEFRRVTEWERADG